MPWDDGSIDWTVGDAVPCEFSIVANFFLNAPAPARPVFDENGESTEPALFAIVRDEPVASQRARQDTSHAEERE